MTDDHQTEALQETAERIVKAFEPVHEAIRALAEDCNDAAARALESGPEDDE